MSEEDTAVDEDMEKFHLEATGEMESFSEFEKKNISDSFMRFFDGHKQHFNEAHLHVQFKQHKEKFRKKPLMYCNINFTTDRGRFHSSAEGWGVENSVSNALEQLDTQIEKKFGKMVAKSRETIRDKAIDEVA